MYRIQNMALPCVLAGFYLASSPARADWITLRDGRRQQCVIVETNARYIRLERSGGVISLSPNEVVKVERESAADNALLHAEYSFDLRSTDPGDFLKSVHAYVAARDQGASGRNLCTSILVLLDYAAMPSAKLPFEARDALARLLNSLSGTPSDAASQEFLLGAAQFLAKEGWLDSALKMFTKIPEAARIQHPEWQKQMTGYIRSDVRALLSEHKNEQAIERMVALGELDPAHSNRVWVALARADSLRRAGRYEEALKTYAGETAAQFPEISRERSIAAINEALPTARKKGDFAPVIDLTMGEALPVLGKDNAFRLRAIIYKEWGEWMCAHQRFAEAREAFKQYYLLEPSDEQPLLTLANSLEQASQLAPDDAEGHYEAGVELRKAHMFEQAALMFKAAKSDPQWGNLAGKQLDDLNDMKLEDLLNQALELKQQKKFTEARALLARVMKDAKNDDLKALAKRTQDLTAQEMDLEKNRAPAEAEVLWQRAERCILPGEVQTCLELLNQILREYPNTPAAARAAQKRQTLLGSGFKDTARMAPLPASTPSSQPASEPAPEGVDRAKLEQEMQQLQDLLEAAANQ